MTIYNGNKAMAEISIRTLQNRYTKTTTIVVSDGVLQTANVYISVAHLPSSSLSKKSGRWLLAYSNKQVGVYLSSLNN